MIKMGIVKYRAVWSISVVKTILTKILNIKILEMIDFGHIVIFITFVQIFHRKRSNEICPKFSTLIGSLR